MATLKLKLDTMQQKRYQSYMLIAMQGMGFIYMSVVMGLCNWNIGKKKRDLLNIC
ncbi:MAG TPA: hypothetical protein VJL78_05330 [Candidatus Nitrosocosmicus sp.]|nr:hypothetical protein [Candidatus Nitrosocosmicus sp.]